ncbi:MAG: T9SS type A sorting domain-containing protein [Bacteroidota bacterium]
MRIKKGTYMLIALMLTCTAGMAQLSSPFNMSPIASSNGVYVSNGGNPIVMNGSGKCLNVSSGLSTVNINNNGKGNFGAGCVETPPVASVLVSLTALNLYPNPTHSTSILKCEGQFDANLSCQVRVMSIDGKMMMSKIVAMKELVAGYMIDASSYAVGTYVVTIDFMSEKYSRKLIKL